MRSRAWAAGVVVAAMVAGSCSAAPVPSEPTAAALAMSDLARASSAASAAEVLAAATGLESLGLDLFSVLATGDGNLVFSPTSIVLALAMAYAGAEGSTATEMARVLHLELDDESFHSALNRLDATLESRSWEGEDEGVLVTTANSLWGQQGFGFEQPFLDTLAVNYGAGLRLVDFREAAEQARVLINDWVAAETNGEITELIPEGVLDALTRLVLVNAVYLDATWASQFDPDLTEDGPFTTLAGSTVTVPMMTRSSRFPYARGDGWQAVRLPYLGEEIAMTLIVPDQGRFGEIEERLTEGLLGEAVAGYTGDFDVDLTLPRFEVRTQVSLSSALQALGMQTAFDPATADFSGMTDEIALYISDVIHESYIAVDEEGTEAAAATAVVVRATSAPVDTVELTIDRPFLFALRDVETGTPLFLGRVTDPAS